MIVASPSVMRHARSMIIAASLLLSASAWAGRAKTVSVSAVGGSPWGGAVVRMTMRLPGRMDPRVPFEKIDTLREVAERKLRPKLEAKLKGAPPWRIATVSTTVGKIRLTAKIQRTKAEPPLADIPHGVQEALRNVMKQMGYDFPKLWRSARGSRQLPDYWFPLL
jgi:hypothetical protein